MGRCPWSIFSTHMDDSLASATRRSVSASCHLRKNVPSTSPTSCHALPSPLELAGSVRMQCVVGTTTTAYYHRRRSQCSRHTVTKGDIESQTSMFNQIPTPSEQIMRATILYALSQVDFSSSCPLASISLRIPWGLPHFRCCLLALPKYNDNHVIISQ